MSHANEIALHPSSSSRTDVPIKTLRGRGKGYPYPAPQLRASRITACPASAKAIAPSSPRLVSSRSKSASCRRFPPARAIAPASEIGLSESESRTRFYSSRLGLPKKGVSKLFHMLPVFLGLLPVESGLILGWKKENSRVWFMLDY